MELEKNGKILDTCIKMNYLFSTVLKYQYVIYSTLWFLLLFYD